MFDIGGATLGLIGTSAVAQQVATFARTFDMKVIYHSVSGRKSLASAFEDIHCEDESKDLSEQLDTNLVLAMRPWDIHLFEQYRKEGT